MITPTPRAALLVGAAAPAALLLGLAAPALWWLPLAWAGLVLLAGLAEAATLPRRIAVQLVAPASACVGQAFAVTVAITAPPALRRVAAALAVDSRLATAGTGFADIDLVTGGGEARFDLLARRRGLAILGPIDLRWTGRLGLVRRLHTGTATEDLLVTPDIRPVLTEAPRLIAEDARAGLAAQPWRGDGGDFDTLVQFRPGIDRRRIDWKASARHADLVAKEYRAERDNNVVLAIDCGRLMMAEADGLTRLDRAITAALLTGAVALRSGDKVGLFGFGARPRAVLPPRAGLEAFAGLQRAMAGLDYAAEETNFALSLSVLAGRLDRRSLILLFTDFVDTTTAELMMRAAGRLLKRHLLVCVVPRDEALAATALARPETPEDVARAVVAGDLLRERQLVMARLHQLGVDVIEAPAALMGPGLVRHYLAIKAAGRL